MPRRTARVAGILACVVALAAPAAAPAETLTYTTPGPTVVTLPTGVGTVHVVAVGGRGGGLGGGLGAVVTGDVRVASSFRSSTPMQIRIVVGGNGGIGLGGANGGGAAGALGLPTLAGGGGGASAVATCSVRVNGNCLFRNALVAAGGGGAGGDGLPGTGGAGGSAGLAGSPGSATATLTAAGGGAAGDAATTTPAAGGAGSDASVDPDCESGTSGASGSFNLSGGAGGLSADLAGHGDAGGGGAGARGGGGGGAGAYCLDDTGTSGGGGGGGSSVVPTGGATALDATGQPSVTISYEVEHPLVTITTPADGGVYAQRSVVPASFRCSPAPTLRARITSCTGTVPPGRRIDTATLGQHEFAVRAGDALGLTFTQTVHYTVTDQTPPVIRRLRIAPRTLEASDPDAFAGVVFRLGEPAQVRVGLERVRPRSGRAARTFVRALAGEQGRNVFRLRARIGRHALAPGRYRLVLVATDAADNRSRLARRRFRVLG